MTPSNTAPMNTPQYVEEPCVYVLQTTLTANAITRGLPVPIDPDSDFMLTGIHGVSTGLFSGNFRLPGGRLYSNANMRSDNFLGTANQPAAIGPPPIYRAGGTGPSLDLAELTGATNTLEICFSGIRRLRV